MQIVVNDNHVMRGLLIASALVLLTGCGASVPVAEPSPAPAPSTTITAIVTPPAPSPTSVSTTAATTTAAPTSAAPTVVPTRVPLACAGIDREVLPGSGRAVALTFDLGGNDAGVPSILRTLAAERVRATFFITGAWARVYPQRVREVAAAGHAIGNHTDTHPHLTTLSDDQVRQQLRAGEASVSALTGFPAKPLFRFPFGERDARTLRLVNAGGWCAFRWTVDTIGWKGTSAGTAADVRVRVLAHLQPGEIVLMHGGANPDDGTTYDADALPSVIRALRERGYGFTMLR